MILSRRSPNRNIEDRFYEEKEFYRCAIKLRHTDYFSAMLHIRSMMRDRPLATCQIYECEFCDGLHVTSGRSHKDYFKLQRSLEHLESTRKTPGYVEKAPSWVQAKDAQMVLDLKTRLLELEAAHKRRQVSRDTHTT
jgi:hypothetical protein